MQTENSGRHEGHRGHGSSRQGAAFQSCGSIDAVVMRCSQTIAQRHYLLGQHKLRAWLVMLLALLVFHLPFPAEADEFFTSLNGYDISGAPACAGMGLADVIVGPAKMQDGTCKQEVFITWHRDGRQEHQIQYCEPRGTLPVGGYYFDSCVRRDPYGYFYWDNGPSVPDLMNFYPNYSSFFLIMGRLWGGGVELDNCYHHGGPTYGIARSTCDNHFSDSLHGVCSNLTLQELRWLGLTWEYCYHVVGLWATSVSNVGDDAYGAVKTLVDYRRSSPFGPPINTVWSVGMAAPTKMGSGESMHRGDRRVSANGRYTLDLQQNGNLVLYEQPPGTARFPIWASNTHSGTRLIMQGDGNLVLYDPGNRAVWASGTDGWGGGSELVVQDDGNLVVYRSGSNAVW